MWPESLWDGLSTGNVAFRGRVSPSSAGASVPPGLERASKHLSVGSTLGSQPIALSCTGAYHMVLRVVAKGADLSPRIKSTQSPTHPSIHPSVCLSIQLLSEGLFSESTSCHAKVTWI